MTKSELVELIASKQTQLSVKDVELAVKTIIEHMSQSLADGQRIEMIWQLLPPLSGRPNRP